MTPETTTTAAPPKTETTDKKPAIADNIVPKKIRILGVPLDLGQSRRGVDMGPSAVRVAGLEARLEAGKFPLILGGDHSVAAGTMAGIAEFYKREHQKVGLIWIDAHSDINTPDTSPSGNVHGMPLAAILGLGPPELANIFNFSPKVQPENCVLVGVRDVDARERENIRKSGIEVFTMRDIDE